MPFTNGAKTGNTNTTILAIVALTVAGVLAVLGVLLLGGQSASAERSAAIIAGVFAFITPTVAALLAYLRANDASSTATNAVQVGIVAANKADMAATTAATTATRVDEIHAHLEKTNGDVTDRLNKLESPSP